MFSFWSFFFFSKPSDGRSSRFSITRFHIPWVQSYVDIHSYNKREVGWTKRWKEKTYKPGIPLILQVAIITPSTTGYKEKSIIWCKRPVSLSELACVLALWILYNVPSSDSCVHFVICGCINIKIRVKKKGKTLHLYVDRYVFYDCNFFKCVEGNWLECVKLKI